MDLSSSIGLNHITSFISWVLFVLLLLPGVFAAKNVSFYKKVRPVYFKLIHNLLGMACFILGLVSLGHGVNIYLSRITAPESRVATVWVIGVIGIWSIITPVMSGYNQVKAIIGS